MSEFINQPQGGPLDGKIISRLNHMLNATANFIYTPSEECDVWKVSSDQDQDRCLWLKRHVHRGRAHKEAQVYVQWLSQLNISAYLVDQPDSRTLLLSHIPGVPWISIDKSERYKALTAVGQSIATLHTLAVEDTDSMSLKNAVMKRWDATLCGTQSYVSTSIYQTLREVVVACKEIMNRDEYIDLLGERCVCHRDLRLENLRWASDLERAYLLDFGQARLDWWGSDWVKLALELSTDYFDVAWRAYRCTSRSPFGSLDKERRYRWLVDQGALMYALGTLNWAVKRQYPDAIYRGYQELKSALSFQINQHESSTHYTLNALLRSLRTQFTQSHFGAR